MTGTGLMGFNSIDMLPKRCCVSIRSAVFTHRQLGLHNILLIVSIHAISGCYKFKMWHHNVSGGGGGDQARLE